MKFFQSSMFLLFAMLIHSCGKDIEVLTPVKDCKIIGNYSQYEKKWRYINYNHTGDIISYSLNEYIIYLNPDLAKNELTLKYADNDVYKKNEDTIFYRRTSGKHLRKIVLKNNLIDELIDSQYSFRVKYEYTDNLMTKESAYRFKGNMKWYERYLVYDTLDLYDYHDTQYGLGDEYVNFENRIVSNFFGLNQKYLRPKEVTLKKYNPSGGLLEDHIYQYTYNTNNRGLVSQKIIKEIKQGIYKDTVSYTYTCKF